MLHFVRSGPIIRVLAVLLFWATALPFSSQAAESPPFRAWWPIVNLEVEAGEFGNSRASEVELAYAGQLRYRLTRNIQPGFEAFGRFGAVDDLSISDQQQKIGPGVFGFIEIKDDVALKYEVSWLFGITGPTPAHSLKWLAEFEYRY